MCGIAGIIAANPSLASVERMNKMTAALAHRGPDGTACWTAPGGNAVLGHRRLAILDLREQAAQPMHFLDRYTIVHNGEIYNYRELKATLEHEGYVFRSQSDTEVILAAYDAWGPDCLDHFDGMFAFAIWDQVEQLLFAARDRFGEKPFYYYLDKDQFVFASEMKALWAAGIPKAMKECRLYNYLTLGYVQNPHDIHETWYRDIHKLPGRYFLLYSFRTQTCLHESYWDIELDKTDNRISEQEAMEKLRSLLSLSVSRRLRSDVPVGTSLSGGLDSTTVLVNIIKQPECPADLQTFSAVFPGFHRDEAAAIQLITRTTGIPNHPVAPNVNDLLSNFDRICFHQEEPFQSASVVAQYKVFEMARQQGVTVLLDGQGADEVLAGYFKHFPWYWRELYRQNKASLRAELRQAALTGQAGRWDWKHKLAARWPHFAETWQIRHRVYRQKQQRDLVPGFVEAHGVSNYDLPHIPSLNGVLYYNTFLNGLEELLQYADRNAMAHGREVRLPFLFHELVSFVFSLPATFKIRDGYTKWLLRKALEPELPASLLWQRTKIGFEPPQRAWMEDHRVAARIQDAKRILVDKGVLKPAAMDKKIQPREVSAADNFDWRYLVAGTLLQ